MLVSLGEHDPNRANDVENNQRFGQTNSNLIDISDVYFFQPIAELETGDPLVSYLSLITTNELRPSVDQNKGNLRCGKLRCLHRAPLVPERRS